MSARTVFSISLATLLLALLVIPLLTNAATCPNLYRSLELRSPRMTGSDVKELQQFLIEQGDLAPGNTTGLFGPLTRAAVRSFQCREMQICAGSEATTGWGRVGPMTRAKIAGVCMHSTSYPPPPTYPTTLMLSAAPQSGNAPLHVVFTSNTNLPISFGDGTTGTLSPNCATSLDGSRDCNTGSYFTTHTYTRSGTFTATINSYTSVATARIMVGIGTPASSATSWSVAPQTGSAPLTTTFLMNPGDAAPSTFYVSFGDGQSSNFAPPLPQSFETRWGASHTYSSAGTYTARLMRSFCPGGPNTCESQDIELEQAHVIVTTASQGSLPTLTLAINGQVNATALPGSTFTVAWSSSNATSCTITNAQNQTNTTPHNVANTSQGAVPAAGTTYTYKLSCTNGAGTTEKTASITGSTTGGGGTNPTAGTCMYKGQQVAEGTQQTLPYRHYQPFHSYPQGTPVICDNGVWAAVLTNALLAAGGDICTYIRPEPDSELRQDYGCTPTITTGPMAVVPRHGRAPLTVRAWIPYGACAQGYPAATILWGDEKETTVVCGASRDPEHTYASPGSYTIQWREINATGATLDGAHIRVDGPTASAQNQSQLANALTALQGALQSLLQLLGR